MNLKNVFKVWRRNWLVFKRTWLVTSFWVVLEPLMYLGAIGFGLGSFVQQINGKSYIDFYYPGLLCNTAIMVSYFEATYGSYTKLIYQKLFQVLSLSPLKPKEILLGELLWCASKGFIGVIGVFVIASLFGLNTFKMFLTLPILFLICVIFAGFGLIMTSLAKNYDSFIYSSSGIIIPLSLISGIYFPIEQMPLPIRWAASLSPITHALGVIRGIQAWNFNYWMIGQLAILLLFAGFSLRFMFKSFARKFDF